MTWENYGIYWHIDHIKPLSWFNLETEFKDAWALSNLQPLEATKNLSKGNRYIG
jgi:5-methylcytosine-specific restriction endonuclease McrA